MEGGNALASALTDITGRVRLDSEDPRWSALFRSRAFDMRVIRSVDMHSMCMRLRTNNLATGNLLQLLDQVAARVKQTTSHMNKPTLSAVEQCCSSLNIVSALFHHMLSTMSAAEIRQHLAMGSDWPRSNNAHTKRHVDGDAIIQTFIDSLMLAFDTDPANISALIALFSTQLYRYDSDDLFLTYVMLSSERELRSSLNRHGTTKDDLHSVRFIRGLVAHVSARTVPPHGSLVTALYSPSITTITHSSNTGINMHTSIWGALSRFLWSPALLIGSLVGLYKYSSQIPSVSITNKTKTRSRRISSQPYAPLANRCAILLSMLLLHNDCKFNAFSEVFGLLQDERFELTELSPTESLHTDFTLLAITLPSLSPEAAGLFAYSLLHTHPTYLQCLFEASIESPCHVLVILVESFLHSLYNVRNIRTVELLYVQLIDLLLIVQDSRARSVLTVIPMSKWEWYKERSLRNANCADVLILCILRAITHALFVWGDSYVLSTCQAILCNVASASVHMHSYSAERLVNVIVRLGRRLIRNTSMNNSIANAMGILCQIADTVLCSGGSKCDVNLLYALIQAQQEVTDVLGNNAVKSALDLTGANESRERLIHLAGSYIHALEDQIANAHINDAKDGVRVLQDILSRAPCVNTISSTSPSYQYIEAVDAASFFLPCAWGAVCVSSPEMPLLVDCISNIDPIVWGLVEELGPSHLSRTHSFEAEGVDLV